MDDLIYYTNDFPSGIIAPSTTFSYLEKEILINGPAAIASALIGNEESFRRALIEAGCLVSGKPDEVEIIKNWLVAPDSSRTVSYLLCSANNCADIIHDMELLCRARVMIVGCGGIGSSICMLLAGAGVKNFLLVDADTIERSNLNRQFFWTLKDIGSKKVNVLARALDARFEGLNIECLDASLGIETLCEISAVKVDAAAITADNPPTLAREAWRLTEACGIPVVSGGYLHHLCTSFKFIPGDCGAVIDASEHLEHECWSSMPSAIMPSYGPMNLCLASVLSSNLLASLAVKTFGVQNTSICRWDSRNIFDLGF